MAPPPRPPAPIKPPARPPASPPSPLAACEASVRRLCDQIRAEQAEHEDTRAALAKARTDRKETIATIAKAFYRIADLERASEDQAAQLRTEHARHENTKVALAVAYRRIADLQRASQDIAALNLHHRKAKEDAKREAGELRRVNALLEHVNDWLSEEVKE
ncbi:hypothetical protein EJ06DRAFT_526143 [Trichodelitschia bisporula]|uniref:Uncharacterized protein n=1 Tax=Trichodelitschia bisporula TaxID=703511 RepID=A0A6G1ICC2_9PEZI|nr:hypothetical protein EJ06DRAFT_526143 [Trichodelitschia bisporula]